MANTEEPIVTFAVIVLLCFTLKILLAINTAEFRKETVLLL